MNPPTLIQEAPVKEKSYNFRNRYYPNRFIQNKLTGNVAEVTASGRVYARQADGSLRRVK